MVKVVDRKNAQVTNDGCFLSRFNRSMLLLACSLVMCLMPLLYRVLSLGRPTTSSYNYNKGATAIGGGGGEGFTTSDGESTKTAAETTIIVVDEEGPLCADGMCYHIPATTTGAIDYVGAMEQCDESEVHEGGWMLASIHTKGQSDLVVSLLTDTATTAEGSSSPQAARAWIGLDRLASEEYEWVDGTAIAGYFRNWATDQPADSKREEKKCVAIQSADGIWEDLHCNGREGVSLPVCSRPDAEAVVEPQCVDGMCYYMPNTFQALDYMAAKEHCKGSEVKGGGWTLASLHTRAQIILVVSLADDVSGGGVKPSMWIGLDRLAGGEYEWVDGSSIEGYFKTWAEQEAVFIGEEEEKCVTVRRMDVLQPHWYQHHCNGSEGALYFPVCGRPDGNYDECEEDGQPCAHTCISDDHGSFQHCQCDEGFVLGDDGFECLDMDECAGDHGCDHTCINTVGSFQCECEEGYTNNFEGSDGFECVSDINECEHDNAGCAHTCINTVPGFRCECEEGFVKGDDGLECFADMCNSGNLMSELRLTTSGEGGLRVQDGFYPRFGSSMTVVGDIDGDGVVDLAVGAIRDDDGGWNRGAAYILFLKTDGTVKAQQKISSTQGGFVGPQEDGSFLFRSVSGLGDVDGDGVVDLAVSAHLDDDGGEDRGAVYILFLKTDGTVKAEQKISSTQGGLVGPLGDGDKFGRSVAGVGDMDGDGVVDMVVGAPWDGEDRGPGALYILFLNSDGTVKADQKLVSSKRDELVGEEGANIDRFGVSVVVVGDVDGDGMVDLAVGASWDNEGGYHRGSVYILFLNADGSWKGEQKISSTQGGLVGPLDDDDYFGVSVAAIGDMDRDGVPDLVVGASKDDDGGGPEQGAVYIFLLNRDGTVKREGKISSTQGGFKGPLISTGRFGFSVAVLGDLDGDGVITLAVTGASKRTYVEIGTVYMLEVPPGFVPVCAADETCATSTGDGTYDCIAM